MSGAADQWDESAPGAKDGFVSKILQGVHDLIEANLVALGIKEVYIGERKKGWRTPAAFVYLNPDGSPRQDSRRHHENNYEIPVRVVVIDHDANRSLDVEVLVLLEKVAQLMDDEQPLPGSYSHYYPVAPNILPALPTQRGQWETIGVLEVVYRRSMERQR